MKWQMTKRLIGPAMLSLGWWNRTRCFGWVILPELLQTHCVSNSIFLSLGGIIINPAFLEQGLWKWNAVGNIKSAIVRAVYLCISKRVNNLRVAAGFFQEFTNTGNASCYSNIQSVPCSVAMMWLRDDRNCVHGLPYFPRLEDFPLVAYHHQSYFSRGKFQADNIFCLILTLIGIFFNFV